MYNSFENPQSAFNVTPSDISDLVAPSVLYIGGTGNIKVTSASNNGTVTFQNIPDGFYIPLIVKKVWSASTTCTNIIGLY
jgi:hypothetical protein